MSKFEGVWVQLLPRATELRQSGLTPQKTCARLAREGFRNKKKYNTVKGWYKRNFDDWPDEGHDARSAISGRRQSNLRYARESNNLPQTGSQAYPQIEQYYKAPHESGGSQQQGSNSFSQQGYGVQQPQIQNTTRPRLVERSSHDYQVASQSSPQHDTLGNQGHDPTIHPSSRQFLPPPRHLNQQCLSYQDASPSAVGDTGLPYQQNCLGFSQGIQSQQTMQVDRARYPARHNPVPQAGLPLEHYIYYGTESDMMDDTTRSPAGSHEWAPPDCYESYESLLNMDFDASVDKVDESVDLASDGQVTEVAMNEGADGSVLASQSHATHAPQSFNNQRLSDVASKSLAMSPPRHGVSASTDEQYFEGTSIQQVEPTFPVADNPHNGTALRRTKAPRHMLPPSPPQSPPAFRRRGNQPSVHPIQMQDSSIVAISPYGYSTDQRRKRARRQLGSETQRTRSPRLSETHHPIGIYHDHHESPIDLSVPVSSSSSNTPQVTTRKPLSNQPVNPTNTLARSNVRDSGHVSLFESAMEEKLRKSLSSLKLTDEPKFKYSESDDGYVDVKVKTYWRVRRSYILSMDSHEAQVDA